MWNDTRHESVRFSIRGRKREGSWKRIQKQERPTLSRRGKVWGRWEGGGFSVWNKEVDHLKRDRKSRGKSTLRDSGSCPKLITEIIGSEWKPYREECNLTFTFNHLPFKELDPSLVLNELRNKNLGSNHEPVSDVSIYKRLSYVYSHSHTSDR